MKASASTPVKPSGVKSPDKIRSEVKTEVRTSQTESPSQGLEEPIQRKAESEISYLLQDANKMWKNQTWYNNQLIAMQRKEAAQQYIFTRWSDIPEGCTTEDRDRVISWALQQAGVAHFAIHIYQPRIGDRQSEPDLYRDFPKLLAAPEVSHVHGIHCKKQQRNFVLDSGWSGKQQNQN